eukprot:m.183334 g.183334  ORF g.183334 m.183334 type:complete len:177 (-) comp53495_c0_seq10:1000-1530(-)
MVWSLWASSSFSLAAPIHLGHLTISMFSISKLTPGPSWLLRALLLPATTTPCSRSRIPGSLPCSLDRQARLFSTTSTYSIEIRIPGEQLRHLGSCLLRGLSTTLLELEQGPLCLAVVHKVSCLLHRLLCDFACLWIRSFRGPVSCLMQGTDAVEDSQLHVLDLGIGPGSSATSVLN